MLETINEQLKTNFYQHPEIQSYLKPIKAVQNDEISPLQPLKYY
jgi:LAO/AO transport system kinase